MYENLFGKDGEDSEWGKWVRPNPNSDNPMERLIPPKGMRVIHMHKVQDYLSAVANIYEVEANCNKMKQDFDSIK